MNKRNGRLEVIVSWWPNPEHEECYFHSRVLFYEDFVVDMMESNRRNIILETVGKVFDQVWSERNKRAPKDYFQLGRRPSPRVKKRITPTSIKPAK